jgi:Predicted drug exporters of the RND superfamily
VHAVRSAPAPFDVVVTGESARLVDGKKSLSSRLPLAIAIIALATFLLLFLMVGSLLVPAKALILNVLSLSATFGALVWVFQEGNLAGPLNFTPTGTISIFTPVLLFCIAFGLSMDYEVFLLSRIKEEYDLGAGNEDAVAIGLERTGRIVTAAALLLALVFVAFATAEVTVVKVFGWVWPWPSWSTPSSSGPRSSPPSCAWRAGQLVGPPAAAPVPSAVGDLRGRASRDPRPDRSRRPGGRPWRRLTLAGHSRMMPRCRHRRGHPEPGPSGTPRTPATTGTPRTPATTGTPRTPGTSRAPGPWKTRLVGRDSELAVLEAERRRAAAGELRCVLVLADAGLGKTRLAGELLARHRRGTIGLSARSFPLGGTAPFALWAEALESHLRTLSAEEVGAVCGGFTDDLAGLCRSVAAARGGAPGPEAPRTRLLEGVAVAVGNLAAQAPVIAVLDDAHLADASSWEALHYLSRNAAAPPCCWWSRPAPESSPPRPPRCSPALTGKGA